MLFSIDEKKSLSLMQILTALTAVLLPVLLGLLPLRAGVYVLFIAFTATLLLRLKSTGKFSVSIFHMILALLFLFGLISSLWVHNKDNHFLFLFVVGTAIAVFSVISDYFSEGETQNAARRILYLITFGGVLCAAVNVCYWIMYIVPYGKNETVAWGFGNSHGLAVFLMLCMSSAITLLKGNSGLRKNLIRIFLFIMLATFILAQSILAWSLAIILLVVHFAGNKNEKLFFRLSIGAALLFAVILVIYSFSGENVFREVFLYGIRSFFGKGGGFWSCNGVFLSSGSSSETVGLLAGLTAACGVIGLILVLSMLAVNVFCFNKLRNRSALIGLIAALFICFVPMNGSITGIILLVGLMAYNMQCAGMVAKRTVKTPDEGTAKKVVIAICGTVVLSAMLLVLSFVRLNADIRYKNKDYSGAYSIYSMAATFNITDSESCRMAVMSLRKGGMLQDNFAAANELINNAIERDPYNLNNLREKALMFYTCKEYEAAADVYREAAALAKNKDEYNLLLVKSLYKVVKLNPKGSSETKRAYEEILAIAQSTENLDCKKEINDVAAKVLAYTKGELNSGN